MRRTGTTACALVYALSGCSPEPAPEPVHVPEPPVYDMERPTGGLAQPSPRDESFRRGVSLGLFVSSEDDAVRRPLYVKFLDEIAAVGATDLQLIVRWGQRTIHDSEITPHATETIDDALLAWVMQEAKSRGLRTFLMPTLHVEERAMGKWRGTLEPADWDRWWWSYRRFVLHYARIAESNGAGLLAVGSELLSTEQQDERWRKLIKDTRRIFHGQLTYSANWDHFEPVSFWDALDVVGVTAYQGLSKADAPSDEQLERGFKPFSQRVRSWAMANGYRYIFTEVGYPAQAHAAIRPWDYREKGAPDLALQLRCYRTLFKAWHADPRLAGLYVWNWFGEGGAQDGGYSPRNKPSEKVLSHWFQGSRSAVSAAVQPTP